MSQIKDNKWLGLRTQREKETDLIVFRIAGPGDEASHGEWLTDAAAWTATESDGRLVVLSAQSTRSLSRSGRVLFTSDSPASFAIRFEQNSVVGKVSVLQPTQVRFATRVAPVRTLVDGNDLPTSLQRYSTMEKTTQVSIPSGDHEITFILR
jgi:hypothetical protein